MKVLKNDQCLGCPFEKRGKYMVPDRVVPGSPVAIIGQNPGKNEENGQKILKYDWSGGKRWPVVEDVTAQPLIGATGLTIRDKLWKEVDAHIPFEDVSLMNVIKCRVDGRDTLPPLEQKDTRLAILHCTTHQLHVPDSVRYILALGQISLWFSTRQKSVEDWRGYVLPFRLDRDHVLAKPRVVDFYFDHSDSRWFTAPLVMPTFHPASLYKGQFDESEATRGNKRFFHAIYHDFKKFGSLIRGEWPLPLPPITHNALPTVWPGYASFDTEYNPETLKVYMWSLADTDDHLYVVDDASLVNKRIGEDSHKLVTLIEQNLLADVNHLPLLMDVSKIKVIEDTMFAHSVLWTGEPHDLSYILSIYGQFNRHKHLGNVYEPDDIHDIDILYAGLDAYTTLHHAWKGMLEEFRKDQQSWDVYRRYRLPLAYLIGNSQRHGIRVDTHRLQKIEAMFVDEMASLHVQAQKLTGDDSFNLGSSYQVADVIYEEDDTD